MATDTPAFAATAPLRTRGSAGTTSSASSSHHQHRAPGSGVAAPSPAISVHDGWTIPQWLQYMGYAPSNQGLPTHKFQDLMKAHPKEWQWILNNHVPRHQMEYLEQNMRLFQQTSEKLCQLSDEHAAAEREKQQLEEEVQQLTEEVQLLAAQLEQSDMENWQIARAATEASATAAALYSYDASVQALEQSNIGNAKAITDMLPTSSSLSDVPLAAMVELTKLTAQIKDAVKARWQVGDADDMAVRPAGATDRTLAGVSELDHMIHQALTKGELAHCTTAGVLNLLERLALADMEEVTDETGKINLAHDAAVLRLKFENDTMCIGEDLDEADAESAAALVAPLGLRAPPGPEAAVTAMARDATGAAAPARDADLLTEDFDADELEFLNGDVGPRSPVSVAANLGVADGTAATVVSFGSGRLGVDSQLHLQRIDQINAFFAAEEAAAHVIVTRQSSPPRPSNTVEELVSLQAQQQELDAAVQALASEQQRLKTLQAMCAQSVAEDARTLKLMEEFEARCNRKRDHMAQVSVAGQEELRRAHDDGMRVGKDMVARAAHFEQRTYQLQLESSGLITAEVEAVTSMPLDVYNVSDAGGLTADLSIRRWDAPSANLQELLGVLPAGCATAADGAIDELVTTLRKTRGDMEFAIASDAQRQHAMEDDRVSEDGPFNAQAVRDMIQRCEQSKIDQQTRLVPALESVLRTDARAVQQAVAAAAEARHHPPVHDMLTWVKVDGRTFPEWRSEWRELQHEIRNTGGGL